MEKCSRSEMEAFLRQLTDSSKLLSLIGLCKNSGKTTILNAVLSSYLSLSSPPRWGLMSVGLDGETVDRASEESKPEVFVTEGTLYVTPAHLWNKSDTSKEILEVLQSAGALGSLLLIRAKSDGCIQLSGPSTRAGINYGIQRLEKHAVDKIMIDGSIDRKVLSVDDLSEVLLCTGHVCFTDHRQTLQETLHIYKLLTQLPEKQVRVPKEVFLSFLYEGKEQVSYTTDQIRREGTEWLAMKSFPWDGIFYRGAVHSRFLSQISTLQEKSTPWNILIPDGSRVFLPRESFNRFISEGNMIFVQRKIPVKAIFVNHQTKSLLKNEDYSLMQGIQKLVTCPVIDWKERLICTNLT